MKYNLSNSSDMMRLQRDLERSIKDQAVKEIHTRKYTVTCPNCGATLQKRPGRSYCQYCHETINLKLDIDFN